MKRERRTFHGVEVRATDNGNISGYAAVFNQDYVLWDSPTLRVVERVKPGAFTKSLKDQDDVRCLFNHDPNQILGRTTAGTLRLVQDDHGLSFDNNPPDTQLGRDLRTSIKRKDITGCSFSFIVTKQTRTEEEQDGKTIVTRVIEEVSPTFDVGPVSFPAYTGTEVNARELRAAFGDEEQVPPALAAVLRSQVDDEPAGGDSPDDDEEPGDDLPECACRCRACFSGDHEECEQYMETCADPANCQGMAERAERAAKKEKKTKRVDGEDLPASAFLYVGDPESPKTWALPWKFSTTEKIKAHLRNALARFSSTKKIPSDKKAGVYKKLVAKCNEYGIHVAGEGESNSADQGDANVLDIAAARTRTLLAESQL
jgi:HK97 family phage prohead protease